MSLAVKVIKALEHVGASVMACEHPHWYVAAHWGRNHLIVIDKDPLCGSDRERFLLWKGAVHWVQSPEDALLVIGQPPAQVPAPKNRRTPRKPKEETIVSDRLT